MEVPEQVRVDERRDEGAGRAVDVDRDVGAAAVMYESPRRVEAKDGAFKDWFAPYEVHVYKFTRP